LNAVTVPCNASTPVTSAIAAHATAVGGRTAITFLRDGEADEENLSFRQLYAAVTRLAFGLRQLADPGDRVILAMHSGLPFVEQFLACLYAGVIAVPVYPPRAREGLERIEAIARDSGARFVISTEEIVLTQARRRNCSEAQNNLVWHTFEALKAVSIGRSDVSLPAIDPDDVAFIQYTSGSTSQPKGVVVLHRNLSANLAAQIQTLGINQDDVWCSWLPLNHDMGLIGLLLNPLAAGSRLVLMSPAHFLQRPMRWLSAISKYRATITGAPNFAFDLCVARAANIDRSTLDLRCLACVINGAEPVRINTLDEFSATFAEAGFRPSAFRPSYGLAEFTLLAAGPADCDEAGVEHISREALEAGRAELATEADRVSVVGSGRVVAGHKLKIIDPNSTRAVADGTIGEIILAGPSCTAGYWNNSGATAASFIEYEGERFVRTGDLGYLRDGKVFVTGRIKDLMILRGRNIYPQDIENIAENATSFCVPGGAIAFVVEQEGQQQICVLQEVRRTSGCDPDQIMREIVSEVFLATEVRIDTIALVRAGSLPRTTSGKKRRSAARLGFLEGALP
jgi:acyl-CoA synthetase (AMP-forming)/AMP-acid ligase II